MSAAPIDYDALAAKHGAVDYDTLAKKYGASEPSTKQEASAPAPPPTPSGFLGSLGESSGLKSLGQAVSHPADTLASLPSAISNEAGRVGTQLKEAWNTPNNQPLKALDRTLYATPFIGSSLKTADEQAASGNYRGAAGTSAGVLGSLLIPGAAEEAGSGLKSLIPTRAKGGKILNSVMETARDQPVTLSPQTMAPLERTQQLAMAGGKPFGAADKLFQRIQSVNPLTYEEARDYASNMSLSPEEKMGLKKSMKYEVPRLSQSFGQDIGRAAEAAGVGPEYQRGMKVYRNGARLEDTAKGIAKYGGRAALGAAGAGGLYELNKALR